MSTKVITGKVRLGYVNAFVPRAMSDETEPKYSVMLIIDKDDAETLGKIKKAVESAKELGKEKVKEWKGRVPANLRLPIRDGAEKPDNPELEGKYFMNVKSAIKPQVVKIVGGKLVEITDPAELYSGCYAKVSIGLYGYGRTGNNGIAAGLNNILFVEEGEPLGGSGASAMSDFADEAENQESTEDWMNG